MSLWFDEAFEDVVRAVWRAVRDAGVASKLADGPYRPHVTINVTSRLRELHKTAHAALAPYAHEPTPRRLPEAWNPHCTIAWGLPAERLPDALAVALRTLPPPITGTADRVGLIDTPAEVELACFPLGAG